MLPGGGFNSGFRDDVRGFRKKNKPGRLIQQYAPVLVVVELVILVVTVLVLRSSISHANKQIAQLQHDLQNSGLENGNLLRSLQQERTNRASTESVLRETNIKLSTAQRELTDLRATSMHADTHCKSLQESFDRTRLQLEAERDAARMELNMANNKVTNLHESVAAKERELGEATHRNLAEHNAKDAQFASKEAEWEAMRKALESTIRTQGGWVPQSPPPAGSFAHPDYAARTGSEAFHASQGGRRERYIDSAEELEREGVVDPSGQTHLAQLLGHLFDLKLAEQASLEQQQPGAVAQPKPPIGHWMAQTLESMGITCKYGTVHMAYILDRHFSLESPPSLVGRAGHGSSDANADAVSQNVGASGQQQGPQTTPVPVVEQAASPPLNPPGVVNQEVDRKNMNAWRLRNQRHHHQKVDAAGFV